MIGPALRGATALVLAAIVAGCTRGGESETTPVITVYAASSTAPWLESVCDGLADMRVKTNFAASSTLARQIEAGAPADVFISANPRWMDHLAERGLIDVETRRNVLANRLILVHRNEGYIKPAFGPVAVGDPAHVPVGIYARQALEHLGWWETIEPRIVPTLDARAALGLLSLGEVDSAIVYASDAPFIPDGWKTWPIPAESHEPILYPAALVGDAPEAARRFLELLRAPDAAALARDAGFTTPDA